MDDPKRHAKKRKREKGEKPPADETGPSTDSRSAASRFFGFFEVHAKKIGAICAILAVLAAVFVPLSIAMIQALSRDPQKQYVAGGPLNFVPQVKRKGLGVWGEAVVMPDDGGRILFGLRIENRGPGMLTGLTARISLSDYVSMVPGRCRYGRNQIADVSISGPITGAGVPLPDLKPGEWVHVVCLANVSAAVPRGHYASTLKVISNEAGEVTEQVLVEVPSTSAEEAVRGLYETTESEHELWGGQPEMALRSKRLLIAQWPELTLEHAHSFAHVPGGPVVSLADLAYDHTLEGQVVKLRGEILGRPRKYPGKDGTVKESFEVGAAGEGAHLLCYTPRSAEDPLEEGERLEIKAVPIAWGPPASRSRELVMAVCPVARVPLPQRSRSSLPLAAGP